MQGCGVPNVSAVAALQHTASLHHMVSTAPIKFMPLVVRKDATSADMSVHQYGDVELDSLYGVGYRFLCKYW